MAFSIPRTFCMLCVSTEAISAHRVSRMRVQMLSVMRPRKGKERALRIQEESHGTHRKLHMVARTAEQRHRRAENERKRYLKKRLKQLGQRRVGRCPGK